MVLSGTVRCGIENPRGVLKADFIELGDIMQPYLWLCDLLDKPRAESKKLELYFNPCHSLRKSRPLSRPRFLNPLPALPTSKGFGYNQPDERKDMNMLGKEGLRAM